MPISLRISPATRQLLWFVGQIGLLIFVVEAFIMLALSGGDLALGSVLAVLFDATSLTLISSPITYFWIVRPFVLSARQANEAVARTAHDLQDALSRLKLQTAAVDRLALISETDARGTIIHANEKFCLTSGYTREELVGRTHALINSGLHPKSFWKDMYATVAKGDVWQGEVRNQAKDGSYYWVRSANVAVWDADGKLSGYLSLRLDITENKKQQELFKQQKHKLDAQNVQLETALNNMARGLSMFDSEARLIVCNKIYRQMYNLPEALLQPGTPFSEIVRYYAKKETDRRGTQALEGEREWIESHVAKLARGESFSHTQHLKNGRTILVTNQPLPNGGWVDLQEDITERERLTSERRRVEQMKNEFISTVSHELRTPLTSIAGSLALLTGEAAGELSEKAARLIAIAHANSQRLVRLVNDILDLEKIESGHLRLSFELLDLRDIAQRSMDSVQAYADQLGVRLILADGPPAPVRGDADRLIQVVTNLLSNACKFSPVGAAVTVSVNREDHLARLSVRDRGPGIPEEFRSRIFSRFAQAEGPDTRTKGGTGLGLVIAREISELHGGQLWFESEPSEGAIFHVDLPLLP